MAVIGAEVRALFARLKEEPRRFFLPMLLPDRNALDKVMTKGRIRHGAGFAVSTEYSEIKRRLQDQVCIFAGRARLERPLSRVLVACEWREPDRRRDPDGIVSGGLKILLDGMGPGRAGRRPWNGCGLLHCDGWHCITGFLNLVTLAGPDDEPGVFVVLAPLQLELPLSKAARDVTVDLRR